MKNGLAHKKIVAFGEHEWICLYQGVSDYQSIISLEASGDSKLRDTQALSLSQQCSRGSWSLPFIIEGAVIKFMFII